MNPQGAHAKTLNTRKDSVDDSIDARGQTVLANRVIEKISSQVVSDEAVAGGSSGGFLGIGVRADLKARPKVSVELSGNMATLSVEVGLLYPVPLRQATEDLRQRIRARVNELTGVEVRQVDIKVSWLTTTDDDAGGERKLL